MSATASGWTRSHAVWALAGFLAGAMTLAVAVWRVGVIDDRSAVITSMPAPTVTPTPTVTTRPAAVETPPPVSPPPAPNPAQPPALEADPLDDLRRRQLSVPLPGMTKDELRSSFDERRGASRRHEAIDILAPRNTPILAVEDGTIARLFQSDAGGMTIYQFDPTTTYVYYYAHLERYAIGLDEGDRVRRRQIIGYVGTSGNAPKDTPHLHFAIFKLTEKKRWWEGAAIDPFLVLGR